MEYTFFIIKKDGQYLSSDNGWHWSDYLISVHFFETRYEAEMSLGLDFARATIHEVYLKVVE